MNTQQDKPQIPDIDIVVDLRDGNARLILRNADLSNRYLRNADLRMADLRGADLRNTDLRGADLRDANLRGADLRMADLRGADLRNANLEYTNLNGADALGAYRIDGISEHLPLIYICANEYEVYMWSNHMEIGYESHPYGHWFSGALSLDDKHQEKWAIWKGYLKQICIDTGRLSV